VAVLHALWPVSVCRGCSTRVVAGLCLLWPVSVCCGRSPTEATTHLPLWPVSDRSHHPPLAVAGLRPKPPPTPAVAGLRPKPPPTSRCGRSPTEATTHLPLWPVSDRSHHPPPVVAGLRPRPPLFDRRSQNSFAGTCKQHQSSSINELRAAEYQAV
jgi:hypothetical protein